MTTTDIKKALYKQKPTAALTYIRKGNAHYIANIESEDTDIVVHFEVPVDDMGEADFYPYMDAKLLNRYIDNG